LSPDQKEGTTGITYRTTLHASLEAVEDGLSQTLMVFEQAGGPANYSGRELVVSSDVSWFSVKWNLEPASLQRFLSSHGQFATCF